LGEAKKAKRGGEVKGRGQERKGGKREGGEGTEGEGRGGEEGRAGPP
jgi:hypothetical protein